MSGVFLAQTYPTVFGEDGWNEGGATEPGGEGEGEGGAADGGVRWFEAASFPALRSNSENRITQFFAARFGKLATSSEQAAILPFAAATFGVARVNRDCGVIPFAAFSSPDMSACGRWALVCRDMAEFPALFAYRQSSARAITPSVFIVKDPA
ncbi:MAG: hypothetical protein LBU11_13275 [Zoogloeaceae bacterium]|jgi:hypothetical protein|nr:hypothetical protein [Zoogloeaceae bacterium]